MKVKLSNVRIAFPTLFEAKTINGEGEPRFSAAFILDPQAPYITELKNAIRAVAKDKWKDKSESIIKKLMEEGRICYKPKPLANGEGEVYAGFEGKYSLNASNKSRPLVLDRDKTPLTAQDGKPYGGSYVDASIELWAQDNKYGKRINATLRGVQFRADGDAFGGGTPASADEFDDLSEGADATEGALA